MGKNGRQQWTGIVLAAGGSRRAGAFKAAVEIGGSPLLRHAVYSLGARCERVIVVTGHRRALIEDLLVDVPGVVTVFNPDFAGDMFFSVRTGAAAVDPDAAGFFLLPVDCPFVDPAVLDSLIKAFDEAGGAHPCVPVHTRRGGHPVLLPRAARGTILATAPPANLRHVLGEYGPIRVPVDDPAVLTDADTPEDLRRLKDTYERIR
ncbi:MAG: nucleotidyltransferase family protein [bacterium]|nr:nucleotidyltransferase family protein [bacterium]